MCKVEVAPCLCDSLNFACLIFRVMWKHYLVYTLKSCWAARVALRLRLFGKKNTPTPTSCITTTTTVQSCTLPPARYVPPGNWTVMSPNNDIDGVITSADLRCGVISLTLIMGMTLRKICVPDIFCKRQCTYKNMDIVHSLSNRTLWKWSYILCSF